MGRRVFFVTDYNPSYIGGMEIHAEECVRYFEKQGNLGGVFLMPTHDAVLAASHFKESTGLQVPLTQSV
ncbi:hypothetical protein HKL94_02005 [Candidatus Parcubacteria bacterium]|nr:hypothetical protein [Candidatus Parcubacteria bacterium]